MSEQTPSQAEGERDPDTGTADAAPVPDSSKAPRTTPSQAEGDRSEDEETGPEGRAGD
ncbi:hypothetical protein [Streptomyces candidus]|uniref:Uncharacterized protein n=1 Tax=Streptomyces candidus TaxID=67283 RepID=A0A7X0HLW5_9ACTN|nr:hypothetical protein [Streptomyces candidus]MBB6438533.1 hypothetical protein [Streptomyces candidus]GHH45553.1 hypothetical protein GCM10018773_35190 [Streptomyces candidus]